MMFKKIGYITIADAITKILSYVLIPIYLGLMTKGEFGEFSFIFSAIAPLGLIISLSLYSPFIRNYCSTEKTNFRQKLTSTVFLSMSCWLISLDLFLFLAKPIIIDQYIYFFKISSFSDEKYWLFLLVVNTGTILLYLYSLLMARKSLHEISIFILARFLLTTALSLSFLHFNIFNYDSVLERLLGILLAELVLIVIYFLYFVRPYLKIEIDLLVLKKQIIMAYPLIISACIGLLMVIIDKSLIAEHYGLKNLANYNLAIMALMPIHMVMSATQAAWSPQLFSIKDKHLSLNQTKRIMRIAFLLMSLAVIAITIIMFLAIRFELISEEYHSVPLIIALASVGVILSSLSQLNNNLFLHLDKTKYHLLVSIITLAVNWVLNLFLIPVISWYGAVISSGISGFLSLTLGIVIIKRLIKI